MIDIDKIKRDFPIFKHLPDLIYLDSAAMSLKPSLVIEAVCDYYQKYSANVFRGIYKLSEKATAMYELTRKKVAQFINAFSEKEVIFVRNTTEALNLIAYSWGRVNIGQNDEIVTTIIEHHSNFVPWQQLVKENGAVLKVVDIDDLGYLLPIEEVIDRKTKLLAITYVSNVLGVINPLKKIISQVKKINPKVIVVVDAAQAIPHLKVDVQDLGCDFLAFSGQKMLGPTGVGVLWGKKHLLESLPPFLFGGEMIREVYLEDTLWTDIPYKFEAGTPAIAQVIGLGKAIDYLNQIGIEKIGFHEKKLIEYGLKNLKTIKNLEIYGPLQTDKKSGVIAFNLKGVHSHDVAQILDEENIAVRSGHHCAFPLHKRLGITA